VWKATTGAAEATIQTNAERFGYASVLWSPNGELVAAGLSNGVTQVLARSGGRPVELAGISKAGIDLLAFSPDSQLIITGSTADSYGDRLDSFARVWDASTGALVSEIGDQGLELDDVGFSPDSELAFTNQLGEESILWKARTGERVASWRNELTLAPELDRLITTIRAGTNSIERNGETGITAVAFTSDGGTLVTNDTEGNIRLWTLGTYGIEQAKNPVEGALASSAAVAVASPQSAQEALSPDGRFRIQFGSGDVIDLMTNSVIHNLRDSAEIESAAFSPDGRRIAVADGTRDVRLTRWEAVAPLVLLDELQRQRVTRSLTTEERRRWAPSLWKRLADWWRGAAPTDPT
jgi:WD40 repeat protein